MPEYFSPPITQVAIVLWQGDRLVYIIQLELASNERYQV